MIFRHACRLGCEGIVSKRADLTLPLGPLARLDQDQGAGRDRGAEGQKRELEQPFLVVIAMG